MRAELTFFLKWESPLTWAVLLGTVAALLILWLSRRLSGALVTLGVSVTFLGIFQTLVEAELAHGLCDVLLRFQVR